VIGRTHFRQRILPIVTTVSSLLFIVTVALWARSYWMGYFITHVGHRWDRSVSADFGKLIFDDMYYPPDNYPSFDRGTPTWGCGASTAIDWPDWRWATLGFDVERPEAGVQEIIVVIPLWAVVALTAILPGIWLRARWNRRFGLGRCARCGYDLRGITDRCPECGTPIPDSLKRARTQVSKPPAGPSPAETKMESPCTPSNSTRS